MTNKTLAESYLAKAIVRIRMLAFLMEQEGRSDVVREAQETVELALKAMLRHVGIEPPKWHDVGEILLENAWRFPPAIKDNMQKLASISKWLKEEREMSLYGDDNLIPTEHYTKSHAEKAFMEGRFVVALAESLIKPNSIK